MSDVLGMGGPEIGDGERRAVERVLRSGRLAQGPEVEAFERELATDLAGTNHAVAVASSTAALDLALAALGIGEGDEVLTTPFTFPAPVNAALRSGARQGGVVTTDDADVAERVRVLRNQGMRDRYEFAAIRWNLRLTEMGAAIGRVQLRHLPDRTTVRWIVASLLLHALDGIDGVSFPAIPQGREHAWHRFTVRLGEDLSRDTVAAKLEAEGIEARVYYPQIVPDMEPYRERPGIDAGQPLERARTAAKTALSLPLHPGMTEDDVGRVADALRSAIRSTRGNGS